MHEAVRALAKDGWIEAPAYRRRAFRILRWPDDTLGHLAEQALGWLDGYRDEIATHCTETERAELDALIDRLARACPAERRAA